MGMTEAKGGLYAALAGLQKELPAIPKGREVKITPKDGKPYSYHYAELDVIAATIMPLLGKHGLAFMARPTLVDGRFVLAYSLLHESGEREDGEYPLPDRGTPQELGKHITYGRRYCLCSVTGVAPGGEDDDARGAAEVTTSRPRRQEQQPREEAAPPGHSEDIDDGDWGVWTDVINDITTPEEAAQADSGLREVFRTGAMGPTKAKNIRAAIKKKAASLGDGTRSPDGRHQEEVPA